MDDELQNILFEEYKIIQSKIDKIGEFQFKVRGWAITLETALLLSLFSSKLPHPITYWLFPLMFIVLLVFQFLEQEQRETRRGLAARAFLLERAIDRLSFPRDENETKKRILDRNALRDLKGAPRIAVTARSYSRNRTINSLKNMFKFRIHIFYYSQYLVIILTLFFFSLFGGFNKGVSNKEIETTKETVSLNKSDISATK